MLFAKFNKSCLITYIGIVFGVMAMVMSFNKMALVEGAGYVRYALACLVISGICDMFDGKFARLFKRTDEEKEFGVQLDSLADTFCFLAVPVVFMMSLGMERWYNIVSYALLILCGVSRLGYFNVVTADSEKAVKTYQGLPVTSTAITYPIVGLLKTYVSISTFKYVLLGVTLLTSILMVVNIKIPKLKGIAYVIMPILAAILVTLLLVL